jgi:hypothetical protein
MGAWQKGTEGCLPSSIGWIVSQQLARAYHRSAKSSDSAEAVCNLQIAVQKQPASIPIIAI